MSKGTKVKAIRQGYAGSVIHPAGQIFVWDAAWGELPTWVEPVKGADAAAQVAPDAPGLARPQTPAEAGVPAAAPVEVDPKDPELVDLKEIGAAAAPAATRGVSDEEIARDAERQSARADKAAKAAK